MTIEEALEQMLADGFFAERRVSQKIFEEIRWRGYRGRDMVEPAHRWLADAVITMRLQIVIVNHRARWQEADR